MILDRESVAEEVIRVTGSRGADKGVKGLHLPIHGAVGRSQYDSGEWECREFDPVMCLSPRKVCA